MTDFLLLLLLCAIAWYWWDTSYCNELALGHCRRYCEAADVQLLDASVVRRRVWLRRDDAGRVQLARIYSFDYYDGSDLRRAGYMVLLGRRVVETRLEPATLH